MLPMIAYVKGYDIENQINTSQSKNLWFHATEMGRIRLIFMAFLEMLSF